MKARFIVDVDVDVNTACRERDVVEQLRRYIANSVPGFPGMRKVDCVLVTFGDDFSVCPTVGVRTTIEAVTPKSVEPSDRYLRKYIRAKTAQGDVAFTGVVVIYTDAPTVAVNCLDGTQAHWRADLCEVLELPEELIQLILDKRTAATDDFDRRR